MLLFALSFKNDKLLVGECGCTVHHAVLNQEVSWVKSREEEEEGEKEEGKEEEGEGGRGVFPFMAYTGRLRPEGVPFSAFGFVKGWGFH